MHLRRVSRSAAGVLVALSVSAAGIATASGPHDTGPKPGKGCGDRNHVHYREAECKKPKPEHGPKHHDGRQHDGHHDNGRHDDD
jgi:hypothetical protein